MVTAPEVFRISSAEPRESDEQVHWTVALAGGEGVRLQDYIERRGGRRIPKQYYALLGSRSGSTGAVLARSLTGISSLIDRELAAVRLDAMVHQLEPVVIREFIEDVEVGAIIEAHARGVELVVTSIGQDVVVRADRQVMVSVVANLLQNAFKFTRPRGHVWLRVRATSDRVLIDVEDECGGLPADKEELFRPFEQRGLDRTGLGLGLDICARGARVNGGEIRVVNRPDTGCVFTLDLPRA